jgi:predicted nucleic acid-binding protein
MILVVDASVAIKWFLYGQANEAHADVALSVLEQSVLGFITLVQPPHFMAEVAAVLARLRPEQVQQDLLNLQDIDHRVLQSPATYATAVALAMRHQHHVFDTLYHAVALNTPGATLLTADQRYYGKVKGEGQIMRLEDWQS